MAGGCKKGGCKQANEVVDKVVEMQQMMLEEVHVKLLLNNEFSYNQLTYCMCITYGICHLQPAFL